jgi:ribosomal protein S18 acetylase RimI-like enzyme
MIIEQLTPSQPLEVFDEIAQIHINEIHHGLLPLLGPKFLAGLYHELSNTPQTVILLATAEGKAVGFLAGCADMGKSFRSVLLRSPLRLMWLATGSIFNRSLLRKLPSVFYYPFRVKGPVSSSEKSVEENDSAAELLAIAVDPAGRGQGVGRRLVALFEERLQQWGVTGYYHVTTNIDEADSNKFYRALAFEPCGHIKHHDLTLQKYRKKVGAEIDPT